MGGNTPQNGSRHAIDCRCAGRVDFKDTRYVLPPNCERQGVVFPSACFRCRFIALTKGLLPRNDEPSKPNQCGSEGGTNKREAISRPDQDSVTVPVTSHAGRQDRQGCRNKKPTLCWTNRTSTTVATKFFSSGNLWTDSRTVRMRRRGISLLPPPC